MPSNNIPAPLSQDEINNILWKACDTFRGTVDPSEYKNYILVMLFVKYLSDVWRDHLEAYQQKYKGDVVVANPPFSLDKWGAEGAEKDRYQRFHRGVPPKSMGDFAFVSHMIETAHKATGRVGVIVPHGVLFRGGAEGKIRQKLVEENLLDTVIGLPAGLFFGTGIPAAILLFKRNKKDNEVLFIDASREFEAATPQNRLRPADIEKILAAYRKRKSIEKYAYLATYEELKENDFNLNIPRYVEVFEGEEEVDIAATKRNIKALERQLSGLKGQMEAYLRELEW